MMLEIGSVIKWGIVMLIVCVSIVVLCYVAHNREEQDEQDCHSCNGDCASCNKHEKNRN